MEEADQDGAVGHAAFETDLALSVQWLFQGQIAQAIGKKSHPLGIPAIASVDDAAQLSGLGAAGKVGWTVAKVKVWPDDRGLVLAPILESFPAGVAVKSLRFAI